MLYPLINGVRHDWSSIEAVINGRRRQLGLQSIDYSHSLEPTKVRGAHAQPIGRTRGEYDAEGSLTLLKTEAAELRAEFGAGYMEQSFQILVAYSEDSSITVDTLEGCRIRRVGNSHSQGTDPLAEEWELDVMKIKLGGIEPLTKPLVTAR